MTFETLLERGWVRLNVPTPYLPYADGEFSTPSGKCELYSQRLAEMGLDPLPTYIPPYESRRARPGARRALSADADLVAGAHLPQLDVRERRRAAPRRRSRSAAAPGGRGASRDPAGVRVRVHNDRGAFTAQARVEESIREGVVWAPCIWWGKLAGDGANANQTTSQRETDLGHGPVFYDNQVEVESGGLKPTLSGHCAACATRQLVHARCTMSER